MINGAANTEADADHATSGLRTQSEHDGVDRKPQRRHAADADADQSGAAREQQMSWETIADDKIGTSFEIKIPENITLLDFAALNSARDRMIADFLKQPNPLLDYLLSHSPPPKPMTLARRLKIYRERIRDAWAVLRGKAEIGDD
jgi:hypothetical protein